MSQAMRDLLDILDIETLEHNLFRGRSPQSGWQRVFGGQVIGQALVAAQRTVNEDRHVHSLHCYFMRPGDPTIPIIYEVERIRDGGSFNTRRVVATQHGQAMFALSCSFQKDEPGFDHQFPMPLDVPGPATLRTQAEVLSDAAVELPKAVRAYLAKQRALEIRPTDISHYTTRDKLPPRQDVWMRPTGPVPDDRRLRTAILAYFSDMSLLDTATYPHGISGFDPSIQMASLDHAMWFHRGFSFETWLLYTQDSPSATGSRGMTRGQIFTEDGLLIASVAQEGLIRKRDRNRTS